MEPNDEIALAVAQMLQTKGTWVRDYKVAVSHRDYLTADFSVITTPEAINELHQLINKPKMNTILRTQADALSAVRGKEFIIASVSVNGDFSIAESPVAHDLATDARTEAKRLAKLSPGKAFVILTLAGAEMVPVNTVSI